MLNEVIGQGRLNTISATVHFFNEMFLETTKNLDKKGLKWGLRILTDQMVKLREKQLTIEICPEQTIYHRNFEKQL